MSRDEDNQRLDLGIFKLRAGASTSRFCISVCLSVCGSVCQKNVKKCQNMSKKCQNMSKKYQNLSKHVKKVLKPVKTSQRKMFCFQ